MRNPCSLPSRQRGSVLVFAALGLSLAVILLSIADIGFVYYYKREYQKAADLAAIAGAKSLINASGVRSCSGGATPAAQLSATQNLGSKAYTLGVACGRWDPTAATRFDTTAASSLQNAVQAVINGTPPRFLPFVQATSLSATAIAIADQPVAQLQIRSTVAAVSNEQGALLNAVVGGLLGGSINLSAVAWDGLATTSINLLQYLDALAVTLGVSAGNYDQLLGTDVTLGQLLDVAADVLNQGGGTGNIGAAVGGLQQLSILNLPAYSPLLKLADVLDVQTGVADSALDATLNVLSLVQGSAQLANTKCAVCATVPVSLPGVAGVTIRASVIEPPQLSAIGNPALAKQNPLGDNRIFVRTAQVRTLISVDLPISGSVLTTIQALLNDTVLSGITNVVNDLLGLNLVGLLSWLLPIPVERDIIDVLVLPSPRVDVNVDAGGGQAYVTDYSCTAGKSLTAPIRTAAAQVRVGVMGTSAADAASQVFSSLSAPAVNPVPILDIGTRHLKQTCLLLLCSTQWRKADGTYTSDKTMSARSAFAGGGIGLKADVPVAGVSEPRTYLAPPATDLPEMGEAPAYQTITSTNVVSSLSGTLTGLQLEFYPPSASSIGTNGLGSVLVLVGSTVNTLVSTISGVVTATLSPLVDPLVNFLLSALGVDLNKVEVGANMSCDGGGATLVD